MAGSYDELLLLRRMLSTDYLPLAVLAGLFVALLFRREAISSLRLFRLGCFFFIVSLAAPSLAELFVASMTSPGFSGRGSAGGMSMAIVNSIAPLSLAAGLMCILSSLMPPRPKRKPAIPQTPPKHPLDD